MPVKYSTAWVEQQVREADAVWLPHHDCALCGVEVGFSFHGPDRVLFETDCDCTSYRSPPRIASYGEVAHWLSLQRDDAVRDGIMLGLRAREG